jgi:imidazole glycerol-phosphate synthase subunit HisF
MIIPRVIPCLLLRGNGLVKTVRFKDPTYLGDPRNTIKIFNEKEVDELVVLDITATTERREPNFKLISELTSECFMPLGYGGGITNLHQMERLFKLGIEKVIINTYAAAKPIFISEASRVFGSQSVVVSIDVKRSLFGRYGIMVEAGKRKSVFEPVTFAMEMVGLGAGEILLNSIDRDGTMQGYDVELIRRVSSAVSIPVIACGGASRIEDFYSAIQEGASAVAAGSMFVFHGKHRAVLITFPKRKDLERIFS